MSLVLKVQKTESVAGFGVLCKAWVPTPIHHAAQTALARSCLKTEVFLEPEQVLSLYSRNITEVIQAFPVKGKV